MRSVTHINKEVVTFTPIEGYTMINTLGVGTFGAVFLAKNKEGKQVAIKKVCLDPRFKSRELELVSTLKHPNNLIYIEHHIHRVKKPDGSSDKYLLLVTDYVPDTLTTFGSKFPFPPPFYLKLYGFQLFAGLAYLHAHGVCHRDIKPSNVLVDLDDGRLQLCDFGSAKFLRPGEGSVSYIATRSYRAPELLLDCEQYTTAVDVWAAGCVLCELLLHGRPLFSGRNNNDLLSSITKAIGTPRPEDLEAFPHNKKYPHMGMKTGKLADCLPSFAQPEFVDLMEKIFVYNPSKRITAAAAMKHPFFREVIEPGACLPNKAPVPAYIAKMRTPEEMLRNYPDGPKP